METVTGIGFKKKDRWRRVASSIALVVKLTAMLEAWWVAFRGLEVRINPGYSAPIYATQFFSLYFSVCHIFNCNNRKMHGKRPRKVSPLIFRYHFPLFSGPSSDSWKTLSDDSSVQPPTQMDSTTSTL